MKRIYLAFVLLAASLSSCQKYLDIRPKGKFIPQTIQDYEELSSNPSYAGNGNAYLERLSDGIYLPQAVVNSGMNGVGSKTYIWAPEYYLETESDRTWNDNYNNIFNANIILQDIDGVEDGTQERKNLVKGNALCNRAQACMNLILFYAPTYNESTAASELGVPLVKIPDLEAKSSRATVKEVYDQIISDLTTALPLLPDKPKNVYRQSKGVANGLLARLYLNMGQYEKALSHANEALKTNNTIFDFNEYRFINPDRPALGIANRALAQVHPEMISYMTTSFGSILTGSFIDPDLLNQFDPKDLRLKFGWSKTDRTGVPVKEPYPQYINTDLNYNIAVPEMMLIAAECQARLNQKDQALKLLNTLRAKRFTKEDFKAVEAATAEDALKLVIRERRIELFGKGLRWFDMKRLDKDTRFAKTYKRANAGQTYTLAPGSSHFVAQIPGLVMKLNPNIVPNPR